MKQSENAGFSGLSSRARRPPCRPALPGCGPDHHPDDTVDASMQRLLRLLEIFWGALTKMSTGGLFQSLSDGSLSNGCLRGVNYV